MLVLCHPSSVSVNVLFLSFNNVTKIKVLIINVHQMGFTLLNHYLFICFLLFIGVSDNNDEFSVWTQCTENPKMYRYNTLIKH